MNNVDFNTKQEYKIFTELPPLSQGYPISAVVIADSISKFGQRITTLELEFPRYILAEFNTHRAFSRNASSSRAIPTKKLISNSEDKFVQPVRYGKNKPGMQADKENLEGDALKEAMAIWAEMARMTREYCARLSILGLHKQWASRPLEWMSTIKVVVTATDFENFFFLRDHPEAQDEIAYLAQAIKVAMNGSKPKTLRDGQWHLPYVTDDEKTFLTLPQALQVSAARCARTSYKTVHGVTSTVAEDMALFERLVHNLGNNSEPFHASPTEHQATPSVVNGVGLSVDESTKDYTGNFQGWKQFRKYIERGQEAGVDLFENWMYAVNY